MKKLILAIFMLSIFFTACKKDPPPEPVNNTNLDVKKKREVILVVYEGVYKESDDKCNFLKNAKCYTITITNKQSSYGLGSSGENDGNFGFTSPSTSPAKLTIHKQSGDDIHWITQFDSQTTSSDGLETSFTYN